MCISIKSNAVKMPALIYGTAWKKERTADLVVAALQAGFRGIDTACQPKHYDEALVGVGLQRMKANGLERKDIYLQTKFTPLSSQDPQQLPYSRSSAIEEQVERSFDVSLLNLQTDYIDGLLLHSPLESHDKTMQAWRALESIHYQGGASQLGISNCYDLEVFKALYADATVKPAIIQNRFYKDTNFDIDMRKWCSDKGIIFQSFWSLTANGDILRSDTVNMLVEKYQKTAEQVFFRYLSQSGIVPLTGTSSEQHMREDLSIFEFSLSAEELHALSLLLIE